MQLSTEKALVEVWRQSLVENAKVVVLGKYVALKIIRTVRVGRRVLIPMKSVTEVVTKGIPCRGAINRQLSPTAEGR